jgi:RNA-directed DNA polymerase
VVKPNGGRRESEGAIVLVIGVEHNAPGGKGPRFDHVWGAGKRVGMAGGSWHNHPGGSRPAVAAEGPTRGAVWSR